MNPTSSIQRNSSTTIAVGGASVATASQSAVRSHSRDTPFGDTTISADLSVYRDEINQIMATSTTTVAAPIPGDVNGDGVVNVQDIAAIASHWMQTAVNGVDPVGDVNQDGIVNSQDLAFMASLTHDANSMSMAGVPEPASYALALSALLGLFGLRRCVGRRVS